MDLGLSGKTAAVAGASAGLGRAAARALAAEGVTVAICGRDRARIDAAASELGPSAVPVVADVSTTDGATAFVEEAIAALGRVDILVPNAGGPPAGTFATTPLEAYIPALQLNLLSTVAMCQAAVPAMAERGWGRVVAITSASVRQPIPTLILSNTARAGVTAFLKTLSLEVAARGVTVNSVQPGIHITDRFRQLYGDDEDAVAAVAENIPVRTVGRPDDFGEVVAFLCSSAARFVTGAALPVDGGASRGLQ
ncbi:MAG TPA: SDR family oxidoreductase [Iamia sp.]|jgi:3-oxoacyl-[acyl-carrier protein] reductase|nr:SDR family oxidoreductase [Iamia sp.]